MEISTLQNMVFKRVLSTQYTQVYKGYKLPFPQEDVKKEGVIYNIQLRRWAIYMRDLD